VDPAYEETGAMQLQLTIGDKTTRQTFADRDQFAAEFLYFSRCLLTGATPEPSGYEGLADVRVIEALLRAAGSRKPVMVSRPRHSRQAISPNQDIHVRPLPRKPTLLHARNPAKS
jgi:hypothetical protein